jgi:hypothetical protein
MNYLRETKDLYGTKNDRKRSKNRYSKNKTGDGKTGGFSLGKTLRVGTYDIEFRVLKIKIGNRYDV